MEEWKDIPNLPGYKISDQGRVFSTKSGKILKPIRQGKGYVNHTFSVDGKVIVKTVHRLVAENFIPNPHNLPQVNHLDEDKTNNVKHNLEWCDNRTNQLHSADSKRKTYTMVSPDGEVITFHGMAKFCRENGLSSGMMCQAYKGNCYYKGWRKYNE